MCDWKIIRNCILVMLTVSLSGVSLTGCFKKDEESRNVQYISEDTPWFDSKNDSFNGSEFGTIEDSSLIYADPEFLVFYKYYDKETYEECSVMSYADASGYSMNVDLSDYFADSESCNLLCCFHKDSEYYAVILNVKNGENHNCVYKLSFEDSPLEYCYEITSDSDHESLIVDRVVYKDNTYYVHARYLEGMIYRYTFFILDDQYRGSSFMDMDESAIQWIVDDDNSILMLGYNQLTSGDCLYFYEVKISEKEMNLMDVDQEKIARYRMGVLQDDGYIYSTNDDLTITKFNIKTGEESVVFDYNNTDAGLSNLRESSLIYCDDDDIMTAKQVYYPSEERNWTIYSLHKAESNPHSGKQIITAAVSFEINILASNAILDFNSKSEDMYVYLTMDYSVVTFEDYERDDDSNISRYNRDLAILSELKNDIRARTGPDILIDFCKYASLYNDDYMTDLSSIINDPNSFNREDYFSNFFDAYAFDGAIYQLPVNASVGGIYAYEGAGEASENRLSFSDYASYIDEYCDGVDPLGYAYGRDYSLDLLIRNSYFLLHDKDGNIDLDNDEFRAICEYCKTLNNTEHSEAIIDGGKFDVFERVHFDFSKMLIAQDKTMYGFPSLSGNTGPVALCGESVGITSCATRPEELFDFIRSILSYDVQMTNTNHNPINREAMEHYANDAVNYANEYIKTVYGNNDYNSTDIIDEYIGYLESADNCWLADDYTLLILREELEPYFEGQKTLDDVIPIAESRINNMIEENR